ncbi:hypothetical protein CI109_106523 [Kwoniella shandongensis]|uniref:Uncharacterized protein n=1 Tax=Kwoniella shandongensis TaxID=1734106 RepID=A0A5M6C1D5_9TREE|nr:uncharacterized protein CI109_002704 [Kwoniella shandongensis]KAA5528947.1 hypothetical protein CI109_002704 [Kwoniella shandongensis]
MATFHPYQHSASSVFDTGSSASPDGSEGTSSLPGGLVDGTTGGGEGGIGKWTNPKAAPVKAACLSCRTKKAKCDGKQPVCGQCSRKGLECVFVKSRRGGARKRRQVVPPTALADYLKKLDDLLAAPLHNDLGQETIDMTNEDTTNIVRQFSTREEVFQRYYDDVHPFVPVMPPRGYLNMVLPTLSPASPFLLAAQTILVLVPHPNDPNPKSSNSKRLRQGTSNALGAQTLELVESMIASGTANLECVQALIMLSLWEWSNSGSTVRNRARSAQAVELSMTLGLNEMDKYGPGRTVEGLDWQRDMARRTWWTVYTAQIVSSIVSGTTPVLGPDDPRVHVDFPVCSIDDHTWPNYAATIRHCARIFALVNSVYYAQVTETSSWGQKADGAPPTPEDTEMTRRKILETDNQVLEMLKEAEKMNVIELVPGGEEEVVRNLQLAARLGLAVLHIHIHRNQAFPEVSLFSKRICGLPQAPDFSNSPGLSTPNTQQGDLGVQISNGAAGGNYHDGTMYSVASSSGYSSGTPQKQEQMTGFDQGVINTNGSGNGNVTGTMDMFNNGSYQADWSNGVDDGQADYDFVNEMWQPETYPEDLPAPWFTYPGGAASLYAPVYQDPSHFPASIVPINTPPSASESAHSRRLSEVSSLASAGKPHKAWGVDDKSDKVLPPLESNTLDIFPPGISLARCATAAHTIVRLEVLHRSAVMAMWDGPPKWAPFCSCGLVTGAYAFLLLALAVQAESSFSGYTNSKSEEVEALLTNVKVILAGLEAYGVMWAGIDAMAGEVRAALEAATRLPFEVQAQIEANTPVEQ